MKAHEFDVSHLATVGESKKGRSFNKGDHFS